MLFQVFSRNNDVNGNPYRLILVYNLEGEVIRRIEARSSMPNVITELKYPQLPSIYLTPKEYNILKNSFDHIPLEKSY